MSASADFNRWLRAIFRSGQTRRDTQALKAQVEEMQRQWSESRQQADSRFAATQGELDAIRRSANERQQESREAARMLSERGDAAQRDLRESLHAAMRQNAESLDARFGELDRRHETMRARIDRLAPQMPEAGAGGEWTATSFAETFRGSAADIRSRLSVYLPDIAKATVRARGAPVMDVGCGRGDWLALLKAHGVAAFGIDESADSVRACVAGGLDARLGDAVASLQARADASVSAVTAFHVIEHMPFAAAAALVVEAHRVIRPGGVLVIETPNCENLLVGASTFWLDPTHVRPYPIQLLDFMATHAGFDAPQLRRLNPNQELLDSAPLQVLPPLLRNLFAGPQDSAIVAMRKEP